MLSLVILLRLVEHLTSDVDTSYANCDHISTVTSLPTEIQ